MIRSASVLFLTLAGLSATSAQAQIKIAVVGPMTGQNAAFGQQFREGAEQAVADINATGGVLGQKLLLEVGDDACDPRQAVSVANQMASENVQLVLGHFCSGSSIPASHVYTEEGIIEISPGSTSPDYTEHGDWNIFRTCGRDDQQGKTAAAYIVKHFANARIAILNDNSAYGKGLAEETQKAINAAGVHEVLASAYTPGEHDYLALVSRLKEAGVNVIYVGGYYPETGLIARQAHEQGMNPTIIGGDAIVTNDYWQIAGKAAEGTLMTFAADPRNRPDAAQVVAEFKAKHIDPEGYVLYTYAALQAWVAGVNIAHSTDPANVAAALHHATEMKTVLGPLAFDKIGDPLTAHYEIYEWNNGTYHQL